MNGNMMWGNPYPIKYGEIMYSNMNQEGETEVNIKFRNYEEYVNFLKYQQQTDLDKQRLIKLVINFLSGNEKSPKFDFEIPEDLLKFIQEYE